ncbi:MAG: hypothetical protein IPN18_10910 [Ignavibacteriales bacterium]|nr:hypothetical protein [Ignavibacteriales bacterium]
MEDEQERLHQMQEERERLTKELEDLKAKTEEQKRLLQKAEKEKVKYLATTDKDSRLMLTRNGKVSGYNSQMAVDASIILYSVIQLQMMQEINTNLNRL